MSRAVKSRALHIRLSPHGGWRILAAVLLTLVATSLTLWLPRYLGEMVDGLVSGNLPPMRLWQHAGIYLGVALLASTASKAMRQIPMRLGPRIAHNLRTDLYRHLLRLDDAQVRRHRVGDLMSRLSSDVTAVSDMVALGGHSLVRAAFTLTLAYTMMFQRSRPLALVLSVMLPVMILIGFVLLRAIRKRYSDVQEQLAAISSFCQESFAGIRVIKGMGMEARRSATFQDLNRRFIRLNLHLSQVEVPAWPFMHFCFALGNVALLLVGGRLVIGDRLSLGTLVEFQQYLMVLQWPTLSLAWTITLVMRGRASLARLQALVEEEPTLQDGPHTRHEITGLQGDLEFRQVSLSLDGRPVLQDVSFRLPPGELLGITGPTGSGKSMLLHLLLRRYDPDQGQVFYGVHDLRDTPAEVLYRSIRVAPQEPVLFSMTLEENLRLAHPGASETELDWALRVSALEQDLEELSDGLHTRVGERGVTLSGGQRQRTAIARALLGNPDVLVLDDSLSAVDTSTEARILERLIPLLRERTGILVSHRYSALRHCDRVLVMRDGRVDQIGSPAELLVRGGYFAELEERQRLEARLEAMET